MRPSAALALALRAIPLALALAIAFGLPVPPAAAQARDPTRAPDAALTAADAASAIGPGTARGEAAGTDAATAPLRHRMVVDGRHYLVERGWLRGVGDSLAGARIERITEREVWLRDGAGLHKWPLYPDVQIRPAAVPAPGAAPAPARRPPKTASSALAAPISAQPPAPKDPTP